MTFTKSDTKTNLYSHLKLAVTLVVMLCSVSGFAQQTSFEIQQENSTKSAMISFKWDDDAIDWNFMNNGHTRSEAQRLFSNQIVMNESDSIVISASASPEGDYKYNLNLSQRRLNSVLSYLRSNFPLMREDKIRVYSKGPDWQGLYDIVLDDPNVPFRDQVLLLIDSKISPNEKAKRIYSIGGGEPYRYMKKYIFHQLRTSTALVIFYPKKIEYIVEERVKPDSVVVASEVSAYVEVEEPTTKIEPKKVESFRYVRPIAFKTNLLFDIATLFNVEVEVPIGKHFSILGEWIFPFWGGLGNRGGVAPLPSYSQDYTLQMLSGSLEVRYWFGRSSSLNNKAQKWNDYNPLNGWFVGLYGGSGMYDFQINKKGMQGEFFINAGITAGYAHPVGKHFHMEYSIGVGYLSTQYYNYTGEDGRKVVNVLPDGTYDRRQQSFIGPTKAKVSIVWIPQFKVKNR